MKEAAAAVVKNLRRERVGDIPFIEFLIERSNQFRSIFLSAPGCVIGLQERRPERDVRHAIDA
jgi:hypothetical protein